MSEPDARSEVTRGASCIAARWDVLPVPGSASRAWGFVTFVVVVARLFLLCFVVVRCV